MKVIIAGSRKIGVNPDGSQSDDWAVVGEAVERSEFFVAEVVSGTAKGVDTLGEMFASYCYIPVKEFKPDWDTNGKKAGILRNIEMGDYADALIAVWDGQSRGTKHMIEYMQKLDKPVYVHCV